MIVVLQRVKEASVSITGKDKAAIGSGILVLLGIESADNLEDISWLCRKIVNMRIFADDEGVMNKSVLETKGEVLVVSQFTLHASTKKGNRPSYIKAAKPEIAIPLYEDFVKEISGLLGKTVPTGEFGADMQVTIILDSKNKV